MNVKRISFKRILAAAVIALCFVVCGFAFQRPISAKAETVDTIEGNFQNGNVSGWTLNEYAIPSQSGIQAIPSGSVTSEREVRNFMAQILFDSLEGGFEFFFGTGDNACKITFDGAKLTFDGLQTSSGNRMVGLNNRMGEGAIVQIEVVGGEISVGVKQKDEPYNVLGTPAAVLEYAEGVSVSDGKIGIRAIDGAVFSVKKINVYSLDSTIDIETEDYTDPKQQEESGENGCNSQIGGTSALLLGGACAAVAVICGVRRKHEKNN